jgi:hypothetical protein
VKVCDTFDNDSRHKDHRVLLELNLMTDGPWENNPFGILIEGQDCSLWKTIPNSRQERRAILAKIYCAQSLRFVDDCSPAYRSNWGTPKSAQRLYRMARHIKFIIDSRNGSNYRKPVSRDDWISDLVWLKKAYFRKSRHFFRWPDPPNP